MSFWSLSRPEAIRPRRGSSQGRGSSQKRMVSPRNDFIQPVGETHQVLYQAGGAMAKRCWHEALVTHQEGEALGLEDSGIGGGVELGGIGGVCCLNQMKVKR